MHSVQRVLRQAHTSIKQLFHSVFPRAPPFSRSRNSATHGSTMDIRESISNQTDVSLFLAKHLVSTKAKDANLVFSPVSIHVVLGLIAAGSKGNTLDQLLSFLKSTGTEELNSLSSQLVTLVFADGGSLGGPQLSFANGVWIDLSLCLKPTFKEIVDNSYKAAARNVDFQTKAVEATKEVNLWVEKETSGLIKEILPSGSVDGSTRLIFANAVYFKGAWNEKFDASKTKEDEFFLLNGSSVQVPFMTSKQKQYIRAFDGFKVLGLPYKQGEDKRKFSMYIFLPDAKDGLPALVEKLGCESGFLEHHLPYQQVKVGAFHIPKFKVSFGFEASEILKGLGVMLPFSGDGLPEMVDSPFGKNLYVSSIFHKSFIEVNEEGTEAAAATAGVIKQRSLTMEDNLDFVADHPFLFVVREDMTGVVLFIGQIHNPLSC
ncbi:serpin-ZX-like [Olea europaea subsp. europaea]|uniref:Serpin-ZX-like n=1 Tax=Olea europaea subsp. europaea TaxID=158383 RepID=A0A8S0PVF9_OLEEU|nr:serpin-ZX-like [Olea europaea subsp. europaea]